MVTNYAFFERVKTQYETVGIISPWVLRRKLPAHNALLTIYSGIDAIIPASFLGATMKQALRAENLALVAEQKHQRHLSFSGAKNVRDLGGYSTADGATVRWNLLYRADSLDKLTNSDLKFLAALNLSRVIDFRSDHERERRPDRIPENMDIRRVDIPMEDVSTKVWHERRDEMVRNVRLIDPAMYMIETNVELATKFTPGYRQFYREILAANGSPILFHCAAGKDRTGFAAASLLKILGVPHDRIVEDYLLTNQYLLSAYKWNLFIAGIVKGRHFAEYIRGFMCAHPDYLNAAFQAVEQDHGSFANYIRNGLGLGDRDVERLKDIYLE